MSVTPPEPAQAYILLRQRILNLNPVDLGLTPSPNAPHVWGVLMETGYDVGTATLICLADGTTSLYYSTGGGMIGSSQYLPVAEASQALVAEAENHLEHLPTSTEFPLPGIGEVRFYILTYGGIMLAETTVSDLTSNNNPLIPLYRRAQDTLFQLRLLAEKKRK